jgi:hypothetical protein
VGLAGTILFGAFGLFAVGMEVRIWLGFRRAQRQKPEHLSNIEWGLVIATRVPYTALAAAMFAIAAVGRSAVTPAFATTLGLYVVSWPIKWLLLGQLPDEN